MADQTCDCGHSCEAHKDHSKECNCADHCKDCDHCNERQAKGK